jgi:hypothetical protein
MLMVMRILVIAAVVALYELNMEHSLWFKSIRFLLFLFNRVVFHDLASSPSSS